MAEGRHGMRPNPQVFLIGYNRSGGPWFRAVFEAAGLNFRHDKTGDLATDLAYSEAVGRVPFQRWPRLQGISGLERWNRPDRPRIEGFKSYEFLQRQFPGARFILNDRDPADWIAARYVMTEGRFLEMEAWHREVETRDLPEIWLRERAAHVGAVLAHFGEDPNFLHFNVSHDPDEKLITWAAGWLALRDLPEKRAIETPRDSIAQIDTMAEQVAQDAKRPRRTAGAPDMGFVDGVVAHCLGTLREGVQPGDNGQLSGQAAFWTAQGITDRHGAPLPVARHASGVFLAETQEPPLTRVQGVLNDLAALGASPPVAMDMLDSRFAGSGGRPGPAQATLVYNRQRGAANLVLWPLPGYHELAPTGTPGGYPRDGIPFADKEDRCIWLGNLTGRIMRSLLPGQDKYPLARNLLEELAEGVTPERRAEMARQFAAIPRYRIVSRLMGRPGFDLGFVLPPKHQKAGQDPLIAPYVTARRPNTWSHGARYVLSLSGNDTGSNFLPAVASQSLLLKEEDGWELFYTAAFRPWEHYVPIAPGGDDLEKRLDWARANPAQCEKIIAAANALFAKFAAPENRTAWLRGVWEEMRQG